MHIGLYITVSAFLLHFLMVYVLVAYLGFQIMGIAVATSATFLYYGISMTIVLSKVDQLNFIQVVDLKNVWLGFPEFAIHVISTVVSKAIGAWAVLTTLFIGCSFSVLSADTVTVLNAIIPFMKMSSTAAFQSIMNLVGQEVGRGDHIRARKLARCIIVEIFIINLIFVTIIQVFRKPISIFITNKPEVQANVQELLVFVIPLNCLIMNF